MNTRKIIYLVLAIIFGIGVIVYGGYDDSPGAQLIGLLVIIAGAVWAIKSRKKVDGSQ